MDLGNFRCGAVAIAEIISVSENSKNQLITLADRKCEGEDKRKIMLLPHSR